MSRRTPWRAREELELGPGDRLSERRARQKLVLDLLLWTAAGVLALFLRVPDPQDLLPGALLYFVLTVPVSLALLMTFHLYQQAYKQVTVDDLARILAAVGIGTGVNFIVGLAIFAVGSGFPRTVPLIQGVLAVEALAGARLVARIAAERSQAIEADHQTRVLLVGAGNAGARIAREIRRHRATGLEAVGYLDDGPLKQRLTIAGLHVLGGIDDMPRVVKERKVTEVLLSLPSASGALNRRVVDLARESAVPLKVLPGVEELLTGEITLSRFRPVQVEDLLRRDPVEFDQASMAGYLRNKVVMVTGAGGSIGSELVRQVTAFDPSTVVLMGQGENSVHKMALELRRDLPQQHVALVIGSVRDRAKVEDVIGTWSPDVVFHAAAHKHVPLLEENPDEAVLNNVGGTRTVAEVARAHGVARFVNVSTDKAVNPVSMLGVSKALAERVVREVAEGATGDSVFVSVRFGNVLGSRGSVVPIFEEQIRHGGPLTITDPQMTRFFMTIPEASRLVIQAGALGENGAVYVLDMGSPLRIDDLAKDLIRLSGADVDDVAIEYSGLRPGEKLHEELFAPEENRLATRHERIMMARTLDPPDGDFMTGLDLLLDAAGRRDLPAMERHLSHLVPGFSRSVYRPERPTEAAIG
jgi:FlaA1/EpsC-like NDP-sugar epimerase